VQCDFGATLAADKLGELRAPGPSAGWPARARAPAGSHGLAKASCHIRRCRRRPPAIAGVSDATGIAVGDSHACALVGQGKVACWGEAQDAANCADACRAEIRLIAGVSGATAISASSNHTCAVISGSVSCWRADESLPVPVAGLDGTTSVATGKARDCAIVGNGAVKCWSPDSEPSTPERAGEIDDVKALAVGPAHVCMLLSDGEIHCSGFSNLIDPAPLGADPDARATVTTY
jgi:hypothetical protein